jgi:NAD(P)-dependent dehydrogenase (short-subunit alcohol dehydrogenase family)
VITSDEADVGSPELEQLQHLFGVAGQPMLVTGGGRGIGAMIALGLARAGARVYIAGRKADTLAATAEEGKAAGGHVVPISADISTEQGVAALLDEYQEHERTLYALVNNAGTAWSAPLEEHPVTQFNRVLAVNLVGPFNLVIAALPLLRAAATTDDPARIINIGSTDGHVPPFYDTFGYSASKAGLHMLTRHLALRLAAENIRVNTIAPGLFETKLTAFRFRDEASTQEVLSEIPVGRAGTPEDITGAVLYLCSRASTYINGAVLPVDGGYASLR